MLTDEQLEIISAVLAPLFQYLEHEVIVDTAKRIQETMIYSRTAEIEAQRLQQLGFSPARIRKEAMKLLKATPEFRKSVAKNTLEHKREVKRLLKSILKSAQLSNREVLQNAAELSQLDNLNLWKAAGKKITDSSFLPQLTEAISRQTADALINLTQTTGFKSMYGFDKLENLYTRELDKAMIKVCTGTFSMEKVVYDTVHSLARSGLRTIDFASGYSMQLDTAVKLAVRTGAHQLSGKIMDADIERTGENLVYVSRHWGARNTGTGHANHRAWQGRVYYIKGGRDYKEEAERIGQASIRSLWEVTGYSADGTQENDPLGLYGFNCRHRHYIWFEGVSEKLPEAPEPEPVTIDGKTYDYYAVSQRMRAKERAIRALKREREALKSLGMDTKEINAKIKNKTAEYKDFCKAAGVKADINRLRYECGTSDLTKTKAWKRYSDMRSGTAAGIGDDDNIPVHKAPEKLEMMKNTEEDRRKAKLIEYERLIADEAVENAIVIEKDGTITRCFGDLNKVYPGEDLGERLRGSYVTHNHPVGSNNEYSFSDDDINLFIDYDLEVLRGIDEKYIYELTRNAEEIDEPIYISEATEYDIKHSIVLEIARIVGIGYRRWPRGQGTD